MRKFVCALLLTVLPGCGGGQQIGQVTTAPSSAPASIPPPLSGLAFNLDIRLGPGITQSPAQAGNVISGTVITYKFTGADPLSKIRVLMDGNAVPASGQFTMTSAHRFDSVVDRTPGSHAPAFSGETADGRTIKLSDYAGKYVFVDFSEVTCPGSVNEASYLRAHSDAWKVLGMEIVTVLVFNANNAPAAAGDLQAWQNTYGLPFPVISDSGHATLIYNTDAILSQTDFPSGYIIDPAGVIRYRFSGFDGPTIDAAVAALFP